LNTDFDILIVGGGLVGASLVRALAPTRLSIALVESAGVGAQLPPSYDDRAIALAWGTRLILGAMGLWPAVRQHAEPIEHIHISDRGRFGFTRLHAAAEGVAALGYVVTASALGRALLGDLEKAAGVTLFSPARLQRFQMGDRRVRATLMQDGGPCELSARLMVAADGGRSMVRETLAIGARERDYRQDAVICNLATAKAHGGWAYERFTDSGPLAMLPMTEGRCSVVWTVARDQVEGILALDDEVFLAALQQRFGWRLGRFSRPGMRTAYPLKLMQAREAVRRRLVLVGNAAHSVHPVSGQGFNLGIRDVAVLADVVAGAARRGEDPGAATVLERYGHWRRRDVQTVAMITDGLARLFTNRLPPMGLARDLGLLALDTLPGVKHLVVRQFMGLNGRLPRLARGLPVD